VNILDFTFDFYINSTNQYAYLTTDGNFLNLLDNGNFQLGEDIFDVSLIT